jgi:hypothetical protein
VPKASSTQNFNFVAIFSATMAFAFLWMAGKDLWGSWQTKVVFLLCAIAYLLMVLLILFKVKQ